MERLADHVDLLTGFPFKSTSYTTSPEAIRLVRGDNVVQGSLRWDNAMRWPTELADEVDRYHLELGDVVVAMDRPWIEAGLKYARIGRDDVPALLVQRVSRLRAGRDLDQGFLYYLIGSRAFTDHVLAVQTGTAVPHISGGQILDFRFRLPSIDEQRAIAGVLGALDHKIEQNRRTARALERLARAIFRAWFLDFEPVKAKAEGASAFPLMPQAVFDALPTRFVDSPIGPVPEGWEVGPFKEVGEVTIGGQWGEDVQADGLIEAACLRGVDLERLREVGSAEPPRRWLKATALDKRRMNNRDVLIAGSGAGPTGRPLWMCAALLKRWDEVTYSNFCKRIRCSSAAHAVFLDAWLHEMRVSNEIWDHVNGTSVPNLDAGSLMNAKVIALPNSMLLDAFSDVIQPMWEFRFSNESRKLAAMRSYLLPRLLSGQVRVKDAEQAVGRLD